MYDADEATAVTCSEQSRYLDLKNAVVYETYLLEIGLLYWCNIKEAWLLSNDLIFSLSVTYNKI